MNFINNQSIFIQIADRIADRVLNDTYKADERIPSVRELALEMEVNPNTVMRSYERLQNLDIIYNKRGIGYFISADAKEKIMTIRHNEFIQEGLPGIFKEMTLLGIRLEEITQAYTNYLSTQNKKS